LESFTNEGLSLVLRVSTYVEGEIGKSLIVYLPTIIVTANETTTSSNRRIAIHSREI